MTDPILGRRSLGFEAFGASVGLALVSGGLAIVLPFLAALTGTLCALAVAAWVADRRHRSAGRRPTVARLEFVAWIWTGGAAAAFLDPPPAFGPYRAVALALGLAAVWAAGRRVPPPGNAR